MLDNVIIVCAIGDIACPIVDHCQTLSFKKNYALICRSKTTKGLIIFYLTTILTMIDNVINRECNR